MKKYPRKASFVRIFTGRRQNFKLMVIVSGFVLLGLITLQLTRAATNTASVETDAGTTVGPATIGNDPVASGGKYVRFGAETTTSSFSFTAAGDHEFGADSRSSMDRVAGSGSKFYLALGDLSYSAGAEDEWCSTFKSKFNDVELLAGNHDVGESSGGNIDRYRQFCPFTLGSLTGDYGKQYYFNYPQNAPLARFIMIVPGLKGSVNINYNVGGAGYIFTQNAIDSAKAAGIKWIVVGMHKNCISIGQKTCDVGTDIMNLLINKRVDVILQGHDHNYQRSHALKCIQTQTVNTSCIADNGSDGSYAKDAGSVIIINGEFGRGFYAVKATDSEAGYFAKSDSTTFGITKYTISATQLSAQYLRSGGGSFADEFVIKAGAATP